MGTFFHSWRRKAGCVTLVMACLSCSMWLRSFYFYDDIRIPGRDPSFHLIFTLPNWFGWVLVENADGGISPRNRTLNTQYLTTSHEYSYRPYRFVYGRIDPSDKLALSMEACPHFYVSYWAIVLPLTLLSAYLILWKPRKRT